MKLFVNKFLKYFIIYFVIFAIIIITLGSYLEKDIIFSKKRLLFEKNKSDIEYLITGTSHTFWGVEPNLFPSKAINVAEKNKPIEIDLKVIENNIRNFKKLRYVIIPIDYFTLYFNGYKDNGAAKLYHHWGLQFKEKSFLKRFHIGTCGIDLEELLLKKNKKDKLNGFEPYYDNFKTVDKKEQARIYASRLTLWNKYFIDTTLAGNIFNETVRVVKLLKDNHIEPVIITMPVDYGFYEYLDPVIKKKNIDAINELVNQTGAYYINFQDEPVFRDQSLFKNQDHLNDKGARTLTLLLVQYINQLETRGTAK